MLLWFFCLLERGEAEAHQAHSGSDCLGVILLIGLVRWLQLGFLESLERMTYDMRARASAQVLRRPSRPISALSSLTMPA